MPGLSANIQPVNSRFIDLSSLTSSISINAVVWGGCVGGRVWQARGVISKEPNFTVVFKGTSRCDMRADTLSRAANTATLLRITSALLLDENGPATNIVAKTTNSKTKPDRFFVVISTLFLYPLCLKLRRQLLTTAPFILYRTQNGNQPLNHVMPGAC